MGHLFSGVGFQVYRTLGPLLVQALFCHSRYIDGSQNVLSSVQSFFIAVPLPRTLSRWHLSLRRGTWWLLSLGWFLPHSCSCEFGIQWPTLVGFMGSISMVYFHLFSMNWDTGHLRTPHTEKSSRRRRNPESGAGAFCHL